jgi:hypothetical protein
LAIKNNQSVGWLLQALFEGDGLFLQMCERFSLADAEWERLPDGHVVGKPVPLFPRIELN